MTDSQPNPKTQTQTKWRLDLLYDSAQDPQIQIDLKKYEKKRREFAVKYKNRTDYLKEEDKLLTVLREYEKLVEELSGARPLMYFRYLTALESGDKKAQGQLNHITNQITQAKNHLTFFPIQLGKITPDKQQQFLQSNKLKKYHYLLQRRFDLAKYDLGEKEEQIINLTDQTSYQMWVQGVENSLSQKTVKYKEQDLPLSEAQQKIAELKTEPRRKLHRQVMRTAAELNEFAENEINAIITHKKIEDDLRGFDQPYDSTLISSENDEQIVLNLVNVVSQNYDLAHRFYQLKAKLLNLDKLNYADRAAKLDKFNQKYSFDQTVNLVRSTFTELDPEFSEIFDNMLEKGQIDAFPQKGKVSGAFCSSSINNPTFVLLNHTDDFNSVTTLGHELGHAIHSELSKSQPVIYQSYSTSTAETASTFFEQFVFEKLIADFSPEQKIIALHNKIQDDINTVFRQIALFQFEQELHQQIKEEGYLSSQQIGQLLNKHSQNYLGPQFELTDLDGNFYILWSHIRYYFYTYTYAYGNLISHALAQKVKQDSNYIQQVKQFLKAGGSDSPKNIFKKIGIDLEQPNFFEQGLKQIKEDIDRLEELKIQNFS